MKKCPECGGKVEQVLSAPAVQFKGSGWYVTDYAKKSGHSGSASDSGGKSESAKDSDAKDSKESKDGKDGKEKKTKTEPAPKKSEKK